MTERDSLRKHLKKLVARVWIHVKTSGQHDGAVGDGAEAGRLRWKH